MYESVATAPCPASPAERFAARVIAGTDTRWQPGDEDAVVVSERARVRAARLIERHFDLRPGNLMHAAARQLRAGESAGMLACALRRASGACLGNCSSYALPTQKG